MMNVKRGELLCINFFGMEENRDEELWIHEIPVLKDGAIPNNIN